MKLHYCKIACVAYNIPRFINQVLLELVKNLQTYQSLYIQEEVVCFDFVLRLLVKSDVNMWVMLSTLCKSMGK